MTAQTPIYGFEYPIPGEPIRNTRAMLQRNAERYETALQGHGLAAPGAADLLQVSGRVTALEPGAWATLPVSANATFNHDVAPQPPCQYRLEGKRVWLRGWGRSTGGAATGATLWGPLPLPFQPGPNVYITTFPIRSTNFVGARVDVQPDGSAKVQVQPLASGEFLNLSVVSWPVG
jgi:hypothetical protein